MNHTINSAGDCSCGQDGVTCQLCGIRICGDLATWMTPVPGKTFNGNVCAVCKESPAKVEAPATRQLPPRPKTVNWSAEQQAIFEWFRTGTGNLVVKARAGTGKTTTIKHAFSFAPEQGKILYAVFNKKNQREAADKITDSRVEVKTLHSLGFAYIKRVWGNAKPDEDVEWERAEAAIIELGHNADKELVSSVCKLVSRLKNTTINPAYDDTYQIALENDCLTEDANEDQLIVNASLKVLEFSKNRDAAGRISFDDMVWLPVAMNWVRKWFKLAVIDEAQDMNLPQLTMARLCVEDGGRTVVVGDDRQAIYIFRGAVHNSMQMMKVTLRASELPLTTTYRCPKTVVAMAKEIVPDYNAAPDAAQGSVAGINEYGAMNMLQPGDAVLSRLNAPLMPLALALLRKHVPARIEGRDIGKQIAGMVKSFKAITVPQFVQKVEDWAAKQRERLQNAKNAEKQIERVNDLAATLVCLSEGCAQVNDIQKRIDELFADTDAKSQPAVILSSVHKAKGLEWGRVFLLSETFRKNGSLEESNIYYVAITRAMKELWLISSNPHAAVINATVPADEAKKVLEAPKPEVPAQPSVEAPKPATTETELNPQLWLADGNGGYNSPIPGQLWRCPGTVFLYGSMEYVSIRCKESGAQCKALGKVKTTMTVTNKETGEKEDIAVDRSPSMLQTSASIDRSGVIRVMSKEELEQFLAGTRPAQARTTQPTGNESNADMAKNQKKKGERKPVAGRSEFIHTKKANGMNKANAFEAVVKAGFDCSKAAFDKIWDARAPGAKKEKGAKKAPPAKPAKAAAPSKVPPRPAPAAPAAPAAAPAPAAPAAPATAPAETPTA